MSYHHRLRPLCRCLLCGCLLSVSAGFILAAAPAPGPAAPPAPPAAPGADAGAAIPAAAAPTKPVVNLPRSVPIVDSTKTSTTAPPAVVINNFVNPEVVRLSSSDATTQMAARAALESAAAPRTGQPSPAYSDAYSRAVNAALVPLMRQPDMKVRLNAAIAAARIAEKSGNANLAPTILAAINDKSEAVTIWGVKGAKFVLPRLLDANAARTADDMARAVVVAVVKYPLSAALAEDAYDALSKEQMIGTQAGRLAKNRAGVIAHVIALMQARYRMYQKAAQVARGGGEAVFPGSVLSDQAALVFISAHAWQVATPQQRQQMAQVTIELVKLWVELAQPLPGRQVGADLGVVSKEDLLDLVTSASSAVGVMASAQGGQTAQAVGPLAKAVKDIKPNMAEEDMKSRVDALEGGMRAAGMMPAAAATAAAVRTAAARAGGAAK